MSNSGTSGRKIFIKARDSEIAVEMIAELEINKESELKFS